jgi:chemotaxis protein CheX
MVTATKFTVVPLPAVMAFKEAAPLAARLRTLRGQPVKLDASRVNRLSGLCLQVLLSARITWTSDNVPIAIESPSAFFAESWALYGAAPFAS